MIAFEITVLCCFVFFNDTATTEIYTLSLHDALPIWSRHSPRPRASRWVSHRHGDSSWCTPSPLRLVFVGGRLPLAQAPRRTIETRCRSADGCAGRGECAGRAPCT